MLEVMAAFLPVVGLIALLIFDNQKIFLARKRLGVVHLNS